MCNEERWLPVVGFEDQAEVSSCGRVRSLDRVVETKDGRSLKLKGRMRKLSNHIHGYKIAQFRVDGVTVNHSVHTLVLEAFVGPRPAGFDACHGDGTRDNNCVGNLRWGTRSENVMDQVRHGTHNMKIRTQCLRGHDLVWPNFTVGNLWRAVKPGRDCLACSRAHANRAYWKLLGKPVDEFDFQAVSDRHYEDIIAKWAKPSDGPVRVFEVPQFLVRSAA